MIWKGLGVLGATAAVIVGGVVGLARLTVPDPPTFSEGLETGEEGPGGSVDFVPTAVGGQLEVTGAREGTINLENQVDGPTYGLGNAKTRIFFDSDPLIITQMSYDGLAFFPDPEDCEFTIGEPNEEVGLTAVRVSCPELVDIRDNGSVAVEGYLALPSDLVIELDLPDTGGTVTVGDITFEPVDPVLFIGPTFEGSEHEDVGLYLYSEETDPENSAHVLFLYDGTVDSLSIAEIYFRQGVAEVDPGECTSSNENLVQINPQASIWELTFSCESVDISSHGAVSVEGDVVYEKIFYVEP